MVLGLIDFLLGGKKKATTPQNNQAANPGQGSQNSQQQVNQQQPQTQPAQNSQPQPEQQPTGQKKSVSEAIQKLQGDIRETNEKMTEVVSNVKTLQESVNTLGHRVDNLEETKKQDDDKISEMEQQMSKFLSLYELINNQYNPFVEKEENSNQEAKKIVLDNNGNSSGEETTEESSNTKIDQETAKSQLPNAIPELKEKQSSNNNLEDSLLELDTINIEEAAGDAVPLTKIKNNTNSLVIILSWLEYLIKKVGIEETRNTLKYYTEVLRWITPEVYFDLDKYLRGMKDKKEIEEDASLTVRDHIVSLYFISKLNEKTLDEKLTRAVLEMIKQ